MKQKRKDLLNNLSSSFYDLIYNKVVMSDLTITHPELNEMLRMLDKQIEKDFELKVPNSPLIFKKTSYRFWDKKRVKEKVEREHIIEVSDSFNKKQLVLFRGYDKIKLYDWIEKTLYLVYRLKKQENNYQGLKGEELISKELRKPNKIKYFEEVI